MGDLRVGVVGVNGIGQAHLFAVPALEGESLAAVCDIDSEAAVRAAADHHVEPYTDAAALFNSGSVDAVVVATPPGTHGDLVRGALAAGLHVYCEKPFVPTADEGHALGRLARDAGRVLLVGHQYRFHKGYSEARRIVRDGELGAIFRANLFATNWFRAQRYFEVSPWRATWRAAGGGVLISHAVHQLDAFLSMTGLPDRVTARAWRARHRAEVEDDVVALLEWVSGARGVIVASLDDPAGTDRIEIHGELGSIAAEGYELRRALMPVPAQKLSDECPDEFPEVEIAWEPVDVARAPSEWFDMLLDTHRDFVGAVRDDRSPTCDATEATRVIELANAAYLSVVRGEPVELPLVAGEYLPVYEQLCSGAATIPTTPGARP